MYIEAKMKNQVMRFISVILVLTVVSAIVVLIIGLISKWTTAIQFSNGCFYGGGVLIVIGLINAVGARTDDRTPGLQDGRLSTQERESTYQILREDIAKNNNRMVYLGVSGLLLWGVAALIPRIWQ